MIRVRPPVACQLFAQSRNNPRNLADVWQEFQIFCSLVYHRNTIPLCQSGVLNDVAEGCLDAGIYLGDEKVVHFTRGRDQELGTGTPLDLVLSSSRPAAAGPCAVCGLDVDSHGVVLSCLTCFLAGFPLYRFEYGISTPVFLAKARGGTCTLAKADAPEMVLHRAKYLLCNGFGCYHIFRNNCEDFAIYCKTGLLVMEGNRIGRSGQAASILGAPVAAVVSSPLTMLVSSPWGLAAVGAGVYCLSRWAADIGVRADVAKVAVEDLAVNLGWSSVAPRAASAAPLPDLIQLD